MAQAPAGFTMTITHVGPTSVELTIEPTWWMKLLMQITTATGDQRLRDCLERFCR